MEAVVDVPQCWSLHLRYIYINLRRPKGILEKKNKGDTGVCGGGSLFKSSGLSVCVRQAGVNILCSCHLDKADGGKGSSENDKEGDCLSD